MDVTIEVIKDWGLQSAHVILWRSNYWRVCNWVLVSVDRNQINGNWEIRFKWQSGLYACLMSIKWFKAWNIFHFINRRIKTSSPGCFNVFFIFTVKGGGDARRDFFFVFRRDFPPRWSNSKSTQHIWRARLEFVRRDSVLLKAILLSVELCTVPKLWHAISFHLKHLTVFGLEAHSQRPHSVD